MSGCVYLMYDADDHLMYVGCTTRLDARVQEHESTKAWWAEVARIEVKHFDSHAMALKVEANLIARLRPKYTTTIASTVRRGWAARLDDQRALHAAGKRCQVANCVFCRRALIDEQMGGRLSDVLYDIRVMQGRGVEAAASALRRMGYPNATTSFVNHCCQHYGITAELAAS